MSPAVPIVVLVEHVKQHALANYDKGGWDYVVESFDDNEIAERLVQINATSKRAAIAEFADWCRLLDDRRRDISGTAF